MIKLGKKNEFLGTEKLRPLNLYGKIEFMPKMNDGEDLSGRLSWTELQKTVCVKMRQVYT